MSSYLNLIFEAMYVINVENKQTGLFRAHKGRRLVAENRRSGVTPFVGASRVNNSVTDFADTPAMFPGGWLTLIYNGDGGTGHAKYQPAPFSASDDVIVLEPIMKDLPPSTLLLFASMLSHQCIPKFGFGYKLTLHRLSRQKLLVPVATDPNGAKRIDWDGLNDLGEELMSVAKSRIDGILRTGKSSDSVSDELKYIPMLITDVFTSMKASLASIDKSKLNLSGDGKYLFVSRSRENNGISGMCPLQTMPPEPGNAITIGLDTQTVAYQPAAFYTGQNIQVLRHESLDEHSGLVLVSLIREQMSRFGWGGNGATLGRLKKRISWCQSSLIKLESL